MVFERNSSKYLWNIFILLLAEFEELVIKDMEDLAGVCRVS